MVCAICAICAICAVELTTTSTTRELVGSLIEMASQTANLDLERIVGEINPNSPTALIQAARILHYCGKNNDELKSKLEACDTGKLTTQNLTI